MRRRLCWRLRTAWKRDCKPLPMESRAPLDKVAGIVKGRQTWAVRDFAEEEAGARRFTPASQKARCRVPNTRPSCRLHIVMQMNYNQAKEFF
jgi:hypothetical protein